MDSEISKLLVSFLDEQAQLVISQKQRLIQVLSITNGSDIKDSTKVPPKKVDKKQVKVAIDPNKPKQPMNAYTLFVQEEYSKYKAKNPNVPAKDIFKILADLWKETAKDVKDKYSKLAENKREIYDKEIAKYNLDHSHGNVDKKDENSLTPPNKDTQQNSSTMPLDTFATEESQKLQNDSAEKKKKVISCS
jgi:hypothetical protein